MAVFYCTSPQFTLEAHHQFGPNVVRLQLVLGRAWKWYIVGCYLSPDKISTIEIIFMAIVQCPCGNKLLLDKYFNIDSARPEVTVREEEIEAVLVDTGLEDML